jgi:DNA repair protein RecO
MAYVTYITEALVCGTFDRNTADRSYLLFTKEAGMLYAAARSVRVEKSKQRYALQEFSLVKVSLVRGKHSWRIGSIESLNNYYHRAESKQARGNVVSIVRLLRRFVKGEEASSELFAFVVDSLETLTREALSTSVAEVVQLRIMAYLGYVDTTKIPTAVRTVCPADIAQYLTEEISDTVNQLYIQAVTSSHL